MSVRIGDELMNMVHHLKKERGQAVVELAILLPVLILILMAIFEFGRVMNAYMIVTHASREGARAAAVGIQDAEVVTRVENFSSTLNDANITVTIDPLHASRSTGDTVTVTVEYDIDVITPIIGAITGNTIHMEAFTSMRVE